MTEQSYDWCLTCAKVVRTNLRGEVKRHRTSPTGPECPGGRQPGRNATRRGQEPEARLRGQVLSAFGVTQAEVDAFDRATGHSEAVQRAAAERDAFLAQSHVHLDALLADLDRQAREALGEGTP